MRRLDRLVIALVASLLSCSPCGVLPRAPISKDVYWPERGPQKSALCKPEAGPDQCLFNKPRCASSDPRCGPAPMGNYQQCYDPAAKRRQVSPPQAGPECTFDGECVVSTSCHGNYCMHYTLYPMDFEVCQLSSEARDWSVSDPLLCGCVRSRCNAFEQ